METNFLIEKCTIEEIRKRIHEEGKNNPDLKSISERNQMNFIIKYFSKPLLDEKDLFLTNTHFKDIITLYIINHLVKERLADKALKIERYLNMTINNLYEEGKISKKNNKNNSFGGCVHFYKEHLSKENQNEVIEKYNSVHQTNFKHDEFSKSLDNIVDLRNFTLHHHSIFHHDWEEKLKKWIKVLSLFLNKNNATNLAKKFRDIIKEYPFSTEEIKKIVIKRLEKNLSIKSLESVKRENPHFLLIEFIKSTN